MHINITRKLYRTKICSKVFDKAIHEQLQVRLNPDISLQGWLKHQNIGEGGHTLPNISGQGGWQDLFPTYLIFKWEGGGGGEREREREDVSTTKSISGGIHNHENLINQM